MQARVIFKVDEFAPTSHTATIIGRGKNQLYKLAALYADDNGYDYFDIKYYLESSTITAKRTKPYYKEVRS